MANVLVLGGGITGLSTAYYLSKCASPLIKKVLLVDNSSRLGGWIQTTQYEDGTMFEHGPRSLRGAGLSGYNSMSLADELGLNDDVISVKRSEPAAKNRFVYINKQLCTLPNGPKSLFVRQAPFSSGLAFQAWMEPFVRPPKGEEDCSVYDFFKRRFGEELAMYASDPLCRGIFAGDCRKLSVRSCFSLIYDLEQKYGSLILGAIQKPKAKNLPDCDLIQRYKAEKWSMWSLKGGLSQLVQALVTELEQAPSVDILTDTQCSRLEMADGKVKVHFQDKATETMDHLFATCPSSSLARLLPSHLHSMADDLDSIQSVTVGVVNLQYHGNQLPNQGFGHLVPSIEPSEVLGVLYESSVFKEHNDTDQATTRITCMMGGEWFRDLFGDPDECSLDHLSAVAARSVREQLGIKDEPFRVIPKLQKDCIPQYYVGHHKTLSSLQTAVDRLPLSLLGASYRGVSVNDCMYHARLEVERWANEVEGTL